jgi:hypothetical protein
MLANLTNYMQNLMQNIDYGSKLHRTLREAKFRTEEMGA